MATKPTKNGLPVRRTIKVPHGNVVYLKHLHDVLIFPPSCVVSHVPPIVFLTKGLAANEIVEWRKAHA